MTVGKYTLDECQKNIAVDDSKNILVVAGAGSGKTLTILGKIKYLLKNGIKENEILCISFTKAASLSLKEKIKKELNTDIDVYTFHKLALNIIGDGYTISDDTTLDYIIDEFFDIDIKNHKLNKIVKNYNNEELINLKKLIKTFIHLFKCNNKTLISFNELHKKINKFYNLNRKRELNILKLILNIFIKYEDYLKENSEIDFDDMIIKASSLVYKNYSKNTKYIIIDEYQDTSYIRFNLIKKIIDKTNSKLLVVGDDFQSIYKFTGCDVNLFLNFQSYFTDSKIMYIENTYRNSSELNDIAGSFVMRNKAQIKKNLKSNKHIKDPIEIIYYKNKTDFKKLLKSVDKEDLLVLGRNNFDINYFIDDEIKLVNDMYNYQDISFKYMTVHKSKGLEANNVIIINNRDATLGFPSKIKEDKLIKLISKCDKYPYSEERRLFYVALTRTKNKVYLFTPINGESCFIKELKKHYKIKTKVI